MATRSASAPTLRTLLLWLTTLLVFSPSALGQLSTQDHLADPGFWPTQPATSRSEFAGPEACRSCHAEKFASQAQTAMRRTAFNADLSQALHQHPKLTFQVGPYHYLIQTDARHSLYTVTDGKQKLSARLLWAFGTPPRRPVVSVQACRWPLLRSSRDIFHNHEGSGLHTLARSAPPRRHRAGHGSPCPDL